MPFLRVRKSFAPRYHAHRWLYSTDAQISPYLTDTSQRGRSPLQRSDVFPTSSSSLAFCQTTAQPAPEEEQPRWKGGTWEERKSCWALTCSKWVPVVVSSAFLTAAQPAMAGELQCPLRAVPAIPGKLELALLNATLCPSSHTAGVDEIGLGESKAVNQDGDSISLVLRVQLC